MVDTSSSANKGTELRVTSAIDTLEFDADALTSPFGGGSAVAGTPAVDGANTFLSLRRAGVDDNVDPYQLSYATQSGIPAGEIEPNDTPAAATGARYAAGTLGSVDDVDVYAFTASAGTLVYVGLDGDPARDNTPVDGALALLGADGTRLEEVDDEDEDSNTGSGAGDLESDTPESPGEGLTYRVATTGTYYVQVSSDADPGTGDYLLSIARNCAGVGAGPTVEPATVPDRRRRGALLAAALRRGRCRAVHVRRGRRGAAGRPGAHRRDDRGDADGRGQLDLHRPGVRRRGQRRAARVHAHGDRAGRRQPDAVAVRRPRRQGRPWLRPPPPSRR